MKDTQNRSTYMDRRSQFDKRKRKYVKSSLQIDAVYIFSFFLFYYYQTLYYEGRSESNAFY